MTDNHVHIGWYTDGYHSPQEVWSSEQQAGINEIVVSSTSTCAEEYKLVVREMHELLQIGGLHIHPVLWLTPRMIKTWGIRYMLHSKIRWQGIKMHWQAHREWFYNKRLTSCAIEIARKIQVPVLLHTGNCNECHASVFESLCSNNSDLTFVLAHGRPVDETIDVLKNCPNTMVDTAFMNVDDVRLIADKGFVNRILFGTDAPINLIYYDNMSISQYVSSQIESLRKVLPNEQFDVIMSNQLYS